MQSTTFRRIVLGLSVSLISLTIVSGCGPTYKELRIEGQNQFAQDRFGTARRLFEEAHLKSPEDPENLHDIAACCVMQAKAQLKEGNPAAAQRDLDRAIDFYDRAINAHPGFKPALMGKNRALELKGQSDEALRTATWAAKYVGPAADQYVFLASEYEQRGDLDTALLHYRQALAMEPNNANVHKGLGMLHLKAGRQDLAIKSLHRSLELNPSQQDVVETLRELGESVPSVEYGP
ncbi:MAG TPA: tetratricopeptide repeat protein [Phycisphaerae bacterium]|nr:tetratricopeptide repeat protein [Phycisphaerae bacterium]